MPREAVSPPAILLLGEPGNGKTYSAATLAKHESIDKLIYICTDPGGEESLIDALQFHKVPIDKVHWRYIPPASTGWDTMEQLAQKVNMMNYLDLAGIKSGINKSDHRQMFEIIECFANFVCQRTGENLGCADEWPSSYAVVFDSLTGLNKIAKDTAVGAKPTLHQGEWGIAMSMEENFIRKFVADIGCPRVMIGHLDKQMDETLGRQILQVSLLGNKLAPQIPHLFSDVIYAYRQEGKFFWSNMDSRISLKSRNLPQGDQLDPDFTPVLERWAQRKQYLEPVMLEDASEELDE